MKVKVPQFRSTRSVTVDTDATAGAIVGVNLYNEDGTLYVPPTNGPDTPTTGISLDDVEVDGAAPITVDGSIAQGAVTVGWNGTTSDVPEGSRLYYTAARFWAALKAALVAGSNIVLTPDDTAQTITIAAKGGVLPMVTGGVQNGQPTFVYFDDGSLMYAEAA